MIKVYLLGFLLGVTLILASCGKDDNTSSQANPATTSAPAPNPNIPQAPPQQPAYGQPGYGQPYYGPQGYPPPGNQPPYNGGGYNYGYGGYGGAGYGYGTPQGGQGGGIGNGYSYYWSYNY